MCIWNEEEVLHCQSLIREKRENLKTTEYYTTECYHDAVYKKIEQVLSQYITISEEQHGFRKN